VSGKKSKIATSGARESFGLSLFLLQVSIMAGEAGSIGSTLRVLETVSGFISSFLPTHLPCSKTGHMRMYLK
jgi:hypothetical protein